MDSELKSIRAAIKTRPNQHYSPELRALIAAYSRKRRDEGATQQSIVDALGIKWNTINRWLESQTQSLIPVRVREPKQNPELPVSAATLSLVSPNGYRLEGLQAMDAVALFRSLQ